MSFSVSQKYMSIWGEPKRCYWGFTEYEAIESGMPQATVQENSIEKEVTRNYLKHCTFSPQ